MVAVGRERAEQVIYDEPRIVGPGQTLILEAEPDEVLEVEAWAFPAASAGGPRLVECGVRYGGTGRTLFAPRASWKTRAGPPDPDIGLEFLESDDQGLARLDLREACEGTPCERLVLEKLAAPFPDRKLEQVVALDDHRAVVSSDLNDGAGGFEVWLVDGARWERISSGAPLSSPPRHLALDPDRQVIVGVVDDGATFELDPGTWTFTRTATTDGGLGRSAFGGGRWLRYGSGGLAVARGPHLPEFPPARVVSVIPAALEAVAVSSASGIWFYSGGTGFAREREVDSTEEWIAGAGDAEVMAFASGRSILLRDARNQLWQSATRPFGPDNRIRGMSAIGEGRLLVVGEAGLVGVFDQKLGLEGSCVVPAIAASVLDVNRAPSGRVAFAVSNELDSVIGDAPFLLRIVLP